jgi:hypothetical protein
VSKGLFMGSIQRLLLIDFEINVALVELSV